VKYLVTLGVMVAAVLLPGAATAATLVPIAPDLTWGSEPIFVTAPSGDQRLFIVERGNESTTPDTPGVIRVAEGNTVKATPFLTVDNTDTFSERGLLSMAFSPDYATSGLFYVFHVANGPDALDPDGVAGDIRIIEYRRSASDPDVADPASARIVFKTGHSAGNHNGGWLAFGPDDMLYFTIGDNATSSNAQGLGNFFGKVLRIDPTDPDGPAPGPLTATIPADNPFVSTPGALGEVYTRGLRNPFRASFAPDGDLVIGDVGEGTIEEVNAGNLAGRNMGWPSCEGFCDTPNPAFTDPVFEYPHDPGGCAVLGGYVIRDPELAGLLGRYLYGDLCRNDLRTLNLDVPGADPGQAGIELTPAQGQLRSFGEDSRGCSYVITNKSVFRVAPNVGSGKDCPRAELPPDPPPPDPLPDVTYTFFAPNSRPLARQLTFAGQCSLSCTIRVGVTVRISRNRFRPQVGRIKLTPVTVSADAGIRTRVTLKVPGRSLKRMRKAARNGSRLNAIVRSKLSGSDGSSGSGQRGVLLIPAKRR